MAWVGQHTLAAIGAFQTMVVHLRPADHRVDPGGPTLRALLAFPTPPAPPPQVTTAAASSPRASVRPPRTLPSHTALRPPPPQAISPAPVSASAGTPIAWGAKVSPGFKRKAVEIAQDLAISTDFLMSCMAFESGETFSPSIRNAAGSGAVGLIQFMPSTARGLHTSTEQLASMTAEHQLDYVARYFNPYRGRIRTIEDIYMTILYPAAIGKSEDHVLFSNPSRAYHQNRGLDADRDGNVTKYEAAAAVRAKYHKGLRPGYLG